MPTGLQGKQCKRQQNRISACTGSACWKALSCGNRVLNQDVSATHAVATSWKLGIFFHAKAHSMTHVKIDRLAPKNNASGWQWRLERRCGASDYRVEDECAGGGLLQAGVATRAQVVGQYPGTDTLTVKPAREKLEVPLPPMWHVMLKNDDFTSFEFVMLMLMDLFGHSGQGAEKIAEDVHYQGVGCAGIFSKHIAETKADQVMQLAACDGFPLKALIDRTL